MTCNYLMHATVSGIRIGGFIHRGHLVKDNQTPVTRHTVSAEAETVPSDTF